MKYLWDSRANRRSSGGVRIFRDMENQRHKRAQQILGPKTRSPRGAFGEKRVAAVKKKEGLGHPRRRPYLYWNCQGRMIRGRAGSSGFTQKGFARMDRMIRGWAGSSGFYQRVLPILIDLMRDIWSEVIENNVWTYKIFNSKIIRHKQQYITMIIWGKEWSKDHNIKCFEKTHTNKIFPSLGINTKCMQ